MSPLSSAPLRIAVLGCGALAEILAEVVYPAVADAVDVRAVVDIRPDRARRLAERLGARGHASLHEACCADDIEAVDIRLPHHLHLHGAEEAARAQLPFLVEKPLATNLRTALAIEEIACSGGPSCGVAENYAFLAPVLAARRLLAAGAIGELLIVRTARVFELGKEWRRDGWRLAPTEGAQGVIIDQATHVARLLRTVIGQPVEVHAYASSRQGGEAGPDSAAVAFRFPSGVIGTQTYCWACPTPAPPTAIPELELFGSQGSISMFICYEGTGGGALLQRPGFADEWHGTGTNYYDSLADVLVEWAGAVRPGREPSCSMREGVRDAAVMSAIAESVDQGCPVPVEPTQYVSAASGAVSAAEGLEASAPPPRH